MRTLVIILIAAVLILGVVGCKTNPGGCGCKGPCILQGVGPCADKAPPAREYRVGLDCDYCSSKVCDCYCR